MSQERQTYTCDTTAVDSSSWGNIGKTILIDLLIGPFRLLNEISNKFLFLGVKVQRVVLQYALVFALTSAVIFSVSDLLLGFALGYVNPIAALCSAGALFVADYMLMRDEWLVTKFRYFSDKAQDVKLSEEIIEQDVEQDVEQDSEQNVVHTNTLESTVAAAVSFDDPLSVFIDDPDELLKLKVHAVAYSDATDARNVETIVKSEGLRNNGKFSVETYLANIPQNRDEIVLDSDALFNAIQDMPHVHEEFSGEIEI